MCVSQARSSGRNPEFFWLLRQLRRSIGWCAMFQSPQRMISRPLAAKLREMGKEGFEKSEFRRLPVRAGGARRKIQADDRETGEMRLDVTSFGVEFRMPEAGREPRGQLRV